MGEAKNIYFTCLKKVNLKFLKMGRMHAPGKGISQSALPYRRSLPTWLKLSSEDVKEQIYKLAKKGLTPSQIGVILRDSHGVAQVKFVTGTKVLRILKAKGLASEIPEDLYHMIKKAVSIRKHLERNRKDRDAKFRLSDRVSHPPFGSLLQDQTRAPTNLEVRIFHRFRSRRLSALQNNYKCQGKHVQSSVLPKTTV